MWEKKKKTGGGRGGHKEGALQGCHHWRVLQVAIFYCQVGFRQHCFPEGFNVPVSRLVAGTSNCRDVVACTEDGLRVSVSSFILYSLLIHHLCF